MQQASNTVGAVGSYGDRQEKQVYFDRSVEAETRFSLFYTENALPALFSFFFSIARCLFSFEIPSLHLNQNVSNVTCLCDCGLAEKFILRHGA